MNKIKIYCSQIQALKEQYDATSDETEREGIRRSYRNISEQVNKEGTTFIRLMRYYENSQECGNEILDIDDVVWSEDIPGLIQAMRENGIEEFTYSSTWSGAVETAWEFTQNGCSLEGLTEVKKHTRPFMSEEWDKGHAYVFRIRK